jgi:hypothetical protein
MLIMHPGVCTGNGQMKQEVCLLFRLGVLQGADQKGWLQDGGVILHSQTGQGSSDKEEQRHGCGFPCNSSLPLPACIYGS